MVAIQRSSLPGLPPTASPAAALDAVATLGFDGCLFNSLLDLSPRLDSGELADVKQKAASLGLRLGSGLGMINPFRPDRLAGYAGAGNGDAVAGLQKAVAAAAGMGLHQLYFVVGTVDDRANPLAPWTDQLDATAALLRRLAPTLRHHAMRLLVKTHEEITTFEAVRLVEAVGLDVLGIALDPVNLVVRLEEPVAAVARVAPFVGQVHIDDNTIRFANEGLRRLLCPVGQGMIGWAAILRQMPDAFRVIELHKGKFDMPIFDAEWRALQAEATPSEIAVLVREAVANSSAVWDQDDWAARLDPTRAALAALDA